MTPLDPERMGRNGQLAMEGAEALGVSSGPISRNAGNCVQCSSCPYGCRIDAKRGMHVSYLPRAVAAGARLRTGVEARRLLVEDGSAVGVECLAGRATPATARAARYTVRARRATIVAGGAFGTPELLIALRARRRPGRPQPPHPPRLLGRRPLRGGGPRLGRRDAELLHRRVGVRAGPARGDLHPARLRRGLAAGRRPRPPGSDARVRPRRLDRGPARRSLGRPGRPAPATAR